MGSDESAPRDYSPQMIEERERLLSMNIKKISVIMQPSNKFAEGYMIAVSGFSMMLPADLTCANRNHVGIFLFVDDDSYDGIYIEFGPYEYSKEQYKNSHMHYLQGSDGMHFFFANYFNIEGLKLECSVDYCMTVRNLLDSISYHGWTKNDYERLFYVPGTQILTHKDSKDFAKKIIKTLGAKRIKKSDRVRTYCKMFVPADIINILEKNEGCINFEERIPIIGSIAGVAKMLMNNDK